MRWYRAAGGSPRVARPLAGVASPHAHPPLNAWAKNHRVHALAPAFVPPKGEPAVAPPAAHQGVRQALLDAAGGLDEGERVAVVLLDARGDREDVGIEDDVLRREADEADQGGRDGQQDQRQGHRQRRLVRVNLVGVEALFAEEGQEDQPEHVEGGEEGDHEADDRDEVADVRVADPDSKRANWTA